MPRRSLVFGATALLLLMAGCTDGGPSAAGARVLASSPPPRAGTVPTAAAAPTTGAAGFTPQRMAPTTAAGVGAAAGVDRSDPDAVTAAVLTTFFTADTTLDQGPHDAAVRASALLTPDYAATILGSPPVVGAGAQWVGWSARGVQLSALISALPDDRPADTPTTAFRIDLVTQTPTTRAGQALAPLVVVAYVALRTTPAGWAVASVEQR